MSFLAASLAKPGVAGAQFPRPAHLGASAVVDTGLQSNDVGFLLPVGNGLWISTRRTLSSMLRDGATQFDWTSLDVRADSTRQDEVISAFAASGQHVAVATTYAALLDQSRYPTGTGLYLSDDGGATWKLHGMTEIFLDRQGMRLPGGDAQCFGLAFRGGDLWAAFETEFAVMTPDFGATWWRYRSDSTNTTQQNPLYDPLVIVPGTPPDTVRNAYRYRHLNYRAFDVAELNGALWVSTNAGVNRSLDGGVTWKNYDAFTAGITGDFVPTLLADATNGIIWAATQSTGIDEAEVRSGTTLQNEFFRDGKVDSLDWDLDRDGHDDGPGKNGVSWTTDGGATWNSYVPMEDAAIRRDLRAWGFAVKGRTLWVAGTTGGNDALLRSDDLGATWRLDPIVTTAGDTVSTEQGTTDVAYANGTLWVITTRGLLRSADDGARWQFVLRYPQASPLGGGEVPNPEGPRSGFSTYAFPSPSAPRLGRPPVIVFALGSPTDVTIDIFDAAGGLVRTIRRTGLGAGNHTVEWDGKAEDGRDVANGVYLYRIRTGDGHSAKGKLMVSN